MQVKLNFIYDWSDILRCFDDILDKKEAHMADTFNMSDVFISYSRKDSEFAHKLYDAFKAKELEVWVDFEDIPLTADWWQEIEAGIDAAETFIFVLTPDSVRSDICRDEIEYAVQANKRIVPILHQEIIEDDDKQKVHEQISAHNWIFFREEDDFSPAFKKLMDSVETDLEHNRTHTRLLVRAKEWQAHKNRSYLLRDEDLHQAESWLTQGVNKSPTPTNLHGEYISASRLSQTNRQRNVLFAVTVALVVAIMLTVFSVFQWRDAQIAREQAELARSQADQAREQADLARDQAEQSAILSRSLTLSAYTQDALSNDKPDLAMALALESVMVDDSQTQVLQALRDAAYAPATRLRLTDHEGFIWDVDFDERSGLILSGASDNTVCLWETRNGRKIACMGNEDGTAHDGEVIAVEFVKNEHRALTADNAGVMKIWNTDPQSDELGKEIQSYTFDEPLQSFRLLPDGLSVLVGMQSGLIHRWMLDTGEIITFEQEHSDRINALAVSSDGKFALSAGDDNVVIYWDIEAGAALKFLEEHTAHVLSVAFSPDGTQALSGGQDNTLVLWDIVNFEVIFALEGHESGVSDVAFGPTPNRITTASWDNSIRIWDTHTHKVVREFQGHTGGINRIDISSDGRFIVSGSFDTDIRLWETRSFVEVGFVAGDNSVLQHLVYSPDGNILVTAHDSGDVHLWDVKGYTHLKILPGHNGRVVSVAISPNSQLVAAISDDNNLIVWDWQTDEQVLALENLASRVYMVLFGTDDDMVYVALKESIRWYDIESGEQLGEVFYDGEIGGNNSLSISPDGTLLLAGLRGSSDNLHLINLETGETNLKLEGHTDGVLSTAFTADGKTGISGSWDNSARIWDLETGKRVHTLIAHTERVSSVDITADGKYAITGSNDRSMHLWALDRGITEQEYSGHTDRIQAVAFHPNGREMITGSIDTTATVWRFPHPLDQLLGWIQDNRYVPDLNCTERDVYQVEPYCADEDD
jgi:WD40 repeat protein